MPASHTKAQSAIRKLANERILVLDGAMGTMIQALKLDEELKRLVAAPANSPFYRQDQL